MRETNKPSRTTSAILGIVGIHTTRHNIRHLLRHCMIEPCLTTSSICHVPHRWVPFMALLHQCTISSIVGILAMYHNGEPPSKTLHQWAAPLHLFTSITGHSFHVPRHWAPSMTLSLPVRSQCVSFSFYASIFFLIELPSRPPSFLFTELNLIFFSFPFQNCSIYRCLQWGSIFQS